MFRNTHSYLCLCPTNFKEMYAHADSLCTDNVTHHFEKPIWMLNGEIFLTDTVFRNLMSQFYSINQNVVIWLLIHAETTRVDASYSFLYILVLETAALLNDHKGCISI